MSVDQTLSIDARVWDSNITDSRYAAFRVKDAMCDRFRDRTGRRPDVDVEAADLPPFGAAERLGPAAGDGVAEIPLKLTLVDAEREYIRQTLEAYDGSVQRAAESLGISRKNLWQKRKKYGLLE